MTIQEAREMFKPATAVEVELLGECTIIAQSHDLRLGDVLADAVKFWSGPGRSIHPRRWKARAEAARRLVARGNV